MSIIERAARSAAERLRDDTESKCAFCGDITNLERVRYDGDIDVITLVRAVLTVIRNPTDEMEIAAEEQDYVGLLREGDLRRFWQAMIDAALNERGA